MNTIVVTPSSPYRQLFLADGISPFVSGLGEPKGCVISDVNIGCAIAFTPTATTITVTGDGPVMVGNGTVRIYNTFGGDAQNVFSSMGALRYFRVWARRKPGTTGAITAQTIIVKGGESESEVEIGRFKVGAVAANDASDPVCPPVEIAAPNGHANFLIVSGGGLVFVLASADSDLEICFEAYGKTAADV